MSLSCRKSLPAFACSLLAASMLPAVGARAADGYFIPTLTVNGEYHTDIDLNSESTAGKNIEGYSALASGIFGVRTPRSVTEVRPMVQVYDYPDRPELRRTNGLVDFKTQYGSLRGEWNVAASYRQITTYETTRASASYDEFNPNEPTVDTAGRTAIQSADRTRLWLEPSYEHKFSEKLAGRLEVSYEKEDVEEQRTDDVDYDYATATGELLWDLTPRTRLGTGLHASKYETSDNDRVDGKGADLSLYHDWSSTLTGSAVLSFERSDVDSEVADANGQLVSSEETTNDVGIALSLVKKGQISNLRFDGGRRFYPSNIGSRIVVDQFRIQYSTNFKQRWTFLAAARADRRRVQGAVETGNDRDYVSGYTQLAWNVTRTWSVNGTYSYYWRQYTSDNAHGDDHVVSLGVTYRGLRPQ